MFLHLSISNSVHAMGGGVQPPGQTPPMATEAGGTHPTGMHSCINLLLINIIITIDLLEWFCNIV